ncbi:MAG: extracellular solute-binding protein [Butyrivibrio sp.]|nr:extracellular solute-binding protein [Butyrivibrio sp.]
MQKKIVGILMSVCMAASMLAGCGSSQDGSQGSSESQSEASVEDVQDGEVTGTITVLTNRTDLVDTKFADYAKQFEEKYPGTEVKFEAITDYEGDVAIRLQTEEYGDVLSIPNSMANVDFPNYFEPLGTVEELKDKYKEQFLFAKYYDGKVYGLASTINAQGIVYNKRIWAEAGIDKLPATPEEFLDDLSIIKEKTDAIPYYTNAAAGWPLTQWQDHCWGSVTGDADYHNNIIPREENPFSQGKSCYVVHKVLYDVISNKLCEEDPITSDWESSKVMINNGQIATMTLGSWAIQQCMDAGENADDIGYMPFPYNIDGKQYATAGADYCFAVNSHSKNKAAARAWIDFMIDESGFALSEGGISLLNDSEMPATLKDFENITLVADNPATEENEGLFDMINNDSEIALYADPEKMRIVEAALGTSSESFDDIMNDWNVRWSEAQKEDIE